MKRDRQKDTISTFLGPGVSIEGTIEFQGTIRVDGNVKGKIYSDGGTVIVGEKAVINANVIVAVAIIRGAVNGTIDASDKIEVYPPGRVEGDIQAPEISIDTGVVFNGNCAMKKRTISSSTNTDLFSKTSSKNTKNLIFSKNL
ncbi:polymer-forming cytoskeletal protein [Thermodesulfobacteriota bacterium]